MKTIEVETSTLSSDVSSLLSYLDEVRDKQAKLMQCMYDVDGMWDGPANQTFVAQYQSDNDRFTALCDSIQRSIECMDFARKNYDECESEVSRLVASIQI